MLKLIDFIITSYLFFNARSNLQCTRTQHECSDVYPNKCNTIVRCKTYDMTVTTSHNIIISRYIEPCGLLCDAML